MKKYTIVLKNISDKEQFQSELIGISSLEYVPDRECNIEDIKYSRCLFSELTDEEASLLKNDNRVSDIKIAAPTILKPAVFTSESLLPSNILFKSQSNADIKIQTLSQQANIGNIPDGSGVDVVIVDGIITGKPSSENLIFDDEDIHPELLDINGNSRVELINWNAYVNQPSSYPYEAILEFPPQKDNNFHGLHVAGTACGATLGWAKNSKIYNISPYTGPLGYQYLSAITNWHLSKGNSRPTITNHSYGVSYPLYDIRYITKIIGSGIEYVAPRETEQSVAEAVINQNGQIQSFNIINSGVGYTNNPDISYNGGGGDEAAIIMASGTVKEITVTNIGSGYNQNSPPNIIFSQPLAGVAASGTCTVNSNGNIDSIKITEWGSGYDQPPTITFDDPTSGITATATATIGSNFIKSIQILNSAPGFGRDFAKIHNDPPFIIFSGGDCVKNALWIISNDNGEYNTYCGLGEPNDYSRIVNGLYVIATKKTNINSTSFKYTLLGGEYGSMPNVSFRYSSPSLEGTAGPIARTTVNEGQVSSIIPSWSEDVSVNDSSYGWFTSPPQIYITNGGGFSEEVLDNFGILLYKISIPGRPTAGLFFPTYVYSAPARDIVMDSLIEDMIESGVVVVAAAGNSFYDIRIPTSTNYDLNIEANLCNLQKANPSIPYEDSTTFPGFLPGSNYTALYRGELWGDNIYDFSPFQGSSPGSASGVITVGSMSYECCPEIKSSFSNSGKRIDIYAPGSQILSSAFFGAGALPDSSFFCNHPKDNRFGMSKLSGTSMASPQVCGAIASYLTEGNVQRSGNIVEQVTQWIKDNSIPTLSNGSFPHDLHEGTNKILYFPNITVRY
jgi:hypothetical protein